MPATPAQTGFMMLHLTSSGTGDTGPAGIRQVDAPLGAANVSTAMEMLVSGVASACDLGADCRKGCFSSRAAFGRSFGFLRAHKKDGLLTKALRLTT